jgi:tight adherence protein B
MASISYSDAVGVALAAAAGWLAVAAGPMRRLSPAADRSMSGRLHLRIVRGRLGAAQLRRRVRIALVPAGVVAVAPFALAAPLPAVTAAIGVAVLRRRLRAGRARREALRQRAADVVVLRALAAELRTGLAPPAALEAAVQGGELPAGHLLGQRMRAAAAADRFGGDAAARLRSAEAASPAAAALAAVWSASRQTGAGLAAPVARIAAAAAADQRVVREAAAALASARSSARLLAALPLIGAFLGALSGTGSLHVLFATGPGQACLLFGVMLDLAGLAWLDRLAARVGA